MPFDISSVAVVFHRVIPWIFEKRHGPEVVKNGNLIWIVNDRVENQWKFFIKIM